MDITSLARSALAPLAAPTQHARLLQLDAPVPGLVVERMHGSEAVCAPFHFTIDCLSPSALLVLDDLLEQPLTLHLAQADGTQRSWHGLCTEAMALGSDGGLARYRLVLEPWTALLRYRRNALIFQDLDSRGVVEQVFADYSSAAFRFEVTRALPVHAITTQYRESDWDFVTRLLADDGLAWRFDAPADGDSDGTKDDSTADDSSPASTTLVIFDRQAEVPVSDPATIRFHRIDATENDDAISAFAAQRQLVPNASHVASWQTAQVASASGEAQADAGNLPALEVFVQPHAGRFEQGEHAQAQAEHRLDALRLPQTLHRGAGSARGLAAGHAFTLSAHPNHAGEAFVPLVVEHRAVNNLDSGITALLGGPGLERGSYRNRFVAVPVATPITPLARPRPTVHGPQTARVVGLPDSALTTSRDHQVRVQFAWQRGTAPNAGGVTDTASSADGHAPGDHSSGTWVPVAEWLAGPNWGSHFLPRIGSEVLVECLHGDLDQPRITGQLYNGEVAPPFTAGIDSPSNHPGTLSGLHTQSLDGSHTQQWGLDDAPGQLRQWLHTSLGESRLDLGYLIGPGTRRGNLQGEGYALATQGWGNVRAAQGLLLSTTARTDATSTQLDVTEAVAQLKGAERTAQAVHDALGQQQVPGLTANTQLTALREAVDPTVNGKYAGAVAGQSAMKPGAGARDPGQYPVERFADPRLLAESPDHLVLATPNSALAWAGQSLHLTVQDDAHFTAGQTFAAVAGQHAALFAQAGPLRAIAANGPVTVQAHTGALELLADQSVTVTATDERIDVLASTKIVLQAGQSQITLDGGDITFECPGNFTVKAAQHPFRGGASGAARLLPLPVSQVRIDNKRKIDSTFALEQLTETAKNSTPAEFIALMLPIFGYDIPAKTYMRLHKALQDGQVKNPEHVIADGSGYPAEFDNATRKIHIHYAAADHAVESREGAWELLTVLLHEFGHYIDTLLRTELCERDADGNPVVADDAPLEEGARYAYAIARLDLTNTSETNFATYQSPQYRGPLKVNYQEARVAIQSAQGADAQQVKGRNGTRDTFGAGRGEHPKSPNSSFGHESIEDVLVNAGFGERDERREIYFGNWLRDFSQLLDPKIVRKPGAAKDITKHLSRQSLTDVLNVVAEVKFVDPANDPVKRKVFAVDQNRLGVYRPSEHIDNPKNFDPKAPNPQSIDPDFEPLATAHDSGVDPSSSMKRYIAKSVAYMVAELDEAAALGRTPDGRRHFGAALHVLEDFFSHSNFVELSLRKMGHASVLPWTSKTDCRHGYPLVTGMFGSTDVIASIAAPIGDVIFDVDYALAEPKKGQTPADRIILILLREHNDPYYLKKYNEYLALRDKLAEYPYLHYAIEIIKYPIKAVISSQNFVFNSLMHLVGNSVDDYQILAEENNPNTNGSTDPTHSQLGKDHDNHPLHVLAAQLAKSAVEKLGTAMLRHWKGNATTSPAAVAAAYFKHPMDTGWQDAFVADWAAKHPNEIKSAASATDLERLHKSAEEALDKLLSQTVREGNDTWAYVNKYYEDIHGEKNQVTV